MKTKNKITLGVNIDHVATLRQARGGHEPEPLFAAQAAERAGADCITVHLREDRRHIQDADVIALRARVKTKLNLEMALNDEIIAIALHLCPDQVTIVPERRQELTTEGGLDVVRMAAKLRRVVPQFKAKKIAVSLFILPEPGQIDMSAAVGAEAIELHTGAYAEAFAKGRPRLQYERLERASVRAQALGLTVNAGHGLNYDNVAAICRLPYAAELNIGHSIVSRAIFCGLYDAVREMKRAIAGAVRQRK